jgi:hypothetical protein
MKLSEFTHPLTLAGRPSVMIPAVAYAMVFLFGSVMITVEIPQLLQQKFGLTTQGLGLQFLGLIIGSLLGEQVGGSLSDFWMNSATRRRGSQPAPEYRLWLSYSGFALTIVGVIVFLVQTQNEPAGKWNITPVVGVAIAAFGNQVVTTVLITYAVDCNHTESAAVGVFITFVRQAWGFIGPFWSVQSVGLKICECRLTGDRFPDMFTNVGVAKSAGVTTALLIGASVIPTALLQWRGQIWRRVQTRDESVA